MSLKRFIIISGVLFAGILITVLTMSFLATPVAAEVPAQSMASENTVTALPIIDDFESGFPANWYWDADWANTALTTTVVTDPHMTVPGQITNTIFSLEFVSGGWGGSTGHNLTPQDWSAYDGISFWMFGSNSGTSMKLTITDDGGEGFEALFTDNVAGWKLVSLPWEAFTRASWQPGGAPNDGLTLTAVSAYGFFLIPGTGGQLYFDQVAVFDPTGTFYIDQIANPPGAGESAINFAELTYQVDEGNEAVISVELTAASSDLIQVDYTTVDGTAVSGTDYVAISGTLTFPAGTTVQTFTVQTIGDDVYTGNRSLKLNLSNPINAALGSRDQATLTIVEDEESNVCALRSSMVDDFEDGELPYGTDGNGLDIGFFTWMGGGGATEITTTLQVTNTVLQMDSDVPSGGWAGLTHHFENAAIDTWEPQDWSDYQAVGFWVYGNNTGKTVFFEVQDNRNPDSIKDDTEIWSYPFLDNFSGWKRFEVMFTDFYRKDIGNGAPNDGFTLTDVHGWAFGSTEYAGTLYLDDVQICGFAPPPERKIAFDQAKFNVAEGSTAEIVVSLNVTATFPITVSYRTAESYATPGRDYTPVAGTLVIPAGNFSATFEVPTMVDSKYEGDENVMLVLSDAISTTLGFQNRALLNIVDDERYDPRLLHDFEGYHSFLDASGNITFTIHELKDPLTIIDFENGSNEISVYSDKLDGAAGGQTAVVAETVTWASPFAPAVAETQALSFTYDLIINGWGYAYGGFNHIFAETQDWSQYDGFSFWFYGENSGNTIQIELWENGPDANNSERFDYNFVDDFTGWKLFELPFSTFSRGTDWQPGGAPNDGFTLTEMWGYSFGLVTSPSSGHFLIDDVLLYVNPETRPGQDTYEGVLGVAFDTTGATLASSTATRFTQTFSEGQDWSHGKNLSFWYYGSNSGETITVELLDNQMTTTVDVDPIDWTMVWSDEFDGSAGTPPNTNIWRHEIGDGTINNNPGWGNSESQFYTDSTANAALDGSGNLAVKVQKVDTATSDLACWYGPCEYTSARLISWDRMEYEFGRVEARILVPDGGPGLWPAFWMLGTDIGEVGWPQSGEIDIMEYVSKNPNDVFGTIHGPGYSGGSGFGDHYPLAEPVAANYHTFTIEWTLDSIDWYVDGIKYHSATPADIAGSDPEHPNEWVFNHPFFVLLNFAIGGNFGGLIDPDIVFPQQMLVDYVRVYQGVNTSERFEASFVDDFTGWQEVELPLEDFVRSTDQPAGAPDDGLTLTEVWGYGFKMPANTSGSFYLDRVYLNEEYILYFPLINK
ncbi:MAG TPA: hypothetical protein DEH25_03975 [Chloroflexi bacterium]|nr:hypothetical protein [Chloroflexota bacterium]